MKPYLKTALFCLTLATCFVGNTGARADDTQAADQAAPKQHHHHGFRMGVCVGQTLAQQGVTLTRGDTSHRDEFMAAVQSCRAQFKSRAPAVVPNT
jgi:hypothetical protein